MTHAEIAELRRLVGRMPSTSQLAALAGVTCLALLIVLSLIL
jgi:hypothetical protein